MPFPPAALPVNLTNATPQQNTHPNLHNQTGQAVNDTVAEVQRLTPQINDAYNFAVLSWNHCWLGTRNAPTNIPQGQWGNVVSIAIASAPAGIYLAAGALGLGTGAVLTNSSASCRVLANGTDLVPWHATRLAMSNGATPQGVVPIFARYTHAGGALSFEFQASSGTDVVQAQNSSAIALFMSPP